MMKRMTVVLLTVALLASLLCVTVSAEEAEYTLGPELVTNGDFEAGVEHWAETAEENGNTWVQSGVGRDGSAGLQLVDVPKNESGNRMQYYRSAVNATPGNRYLLSFDYLANPGNKFIVRSSALGWNKATITLGDEADGTWKTYTKQFIVPTTYASKGNADFAVYLEKVNKDAPVVIDNISIRECTLNAKPQSVKMDYNEITLLKGRTQTLKYLVDPVKSDINNTVWASADETVATVESGKVTAVGAGTTDITVTLANGLSASCSVTVVDKEATDADLTVTKLTWTGGDGQVKPGTELVFTVEVKNVGTADVTEPFDVDVAAGQERLMRLNYNKGIKAGETVTLTSEPWAAAEGDHMMSARVNPTLTVAESNDRTNNAYQINLRVANDRLVPAYNADLVTEAGMTNLTFSEDFDSLDTVDMTASGKEGYKWYVTRPYSATTLTPDDYSIKDGIMYLHSEVSTYNYGLSTVDIPTWNGYTFNKGYMEFRIRIPHYDGDLSGGPAVWSMPENKLHNKDVEMWVEIDWMEYWGVTSSKPEGYYTITLHEQWVDETITVTDWYSNEKNKGKRGFGDGEWHTLGFLWEENHLRAFYDGEQVLDQTYGKDEIPNPPATISQGEIRFDNIFTYMNEQQSPIFINGSKGNPMEIDYLRIWQYGNETDIPEEAPDTGDTSALPAMVTLLTASAACLALTRKRK